MAAMGVVPAFDELEDPLSAYRKIIDSLIESHRGRFVNSAGDSVLAEFTSVVEAVNCAVEIQTTLKAENNDIVSQSCCRHPY
jgi:adenylate cyclase